MAVVEVERVFGNIRTEHQSVLPTIPWKEWARAYLPRPQLDWEFEVFGLPYSLRVDTKGGRLQELHMLRLKRDILAETGEDLRVMKLDKARRKVLSQNKAPLSIYFAPVAA